MILSENGYLYVAYGDKYIEESIVSAKSLKNINKNVHITLITNKPVENSPFDYVMILKTEIEGEGFIGKLFKVEGIQHSPYNKTIFIDTDTYFIEDCNELFTILDYYDILCAQAPATNKVVEINGSNLEGYYPYNSGVIGFNSTGSVNNFLRIWRDLYLKQFSSERSDQVPFMSALIQSKVKSYTIQSKYNLRLGFCHSTINGKVKILHGRHPLGFKNIAILVNKRKENRVWIPQLGICIPRERNRFIKNPILRFLDFYYKCIRY